MLKIMMAKHCIFKITLNLLGLEFSPNSQIWISVSNITERFSNGILMEHLQAVTKIALLPWKTLYPNQGALFI